MHEGRKVFKTANEYGKYGNGIVMSTVRCLSPKGRDVYLLQIKFSKMEGIVSVYEDEVEFISDA